MILRVIHLGEGGAFCRCRVPFRLGATFPAEFVIDGLVRGRRPGVFRAYCRVVWTAARIGPSRPLQEIGLSFLEISRSDQERIGALLTRLAAA